MALADREGAVLRALNDLESLRRALRLYPASHPALQPGRERTRARVQELGADGEVGTLSFGPDELFWNGEKVSVPVAAPAARFVTLIFHLGVAAVRLRFPQAGDGLVGLAALIATLHDPPGESDRTNLLTEGGALSGVELVPLDLSGVQLVSPGVPTPPPGSWPVWAELARRLARDGAFPLAGTIREGELTPGTVLDLLATTSNPETLFDHLFMHLGEIVQAGPDARHATILVETREFFAELVRLLDPERQKLAVAVALRHIPELAGRDPWVAVDLLLDAVELMLVLEAPIPEAVQRALYRLGEPAPEGGAELPREVSERARRLSAQVSPSQAADVAPSDTGAETPPASWEGSPWVGELVTELGEERVRLHLVRLLQEGITLWPGEPVARRAAVRLAEEFAAALEVGDVATAGRLAPLLAASADPEARQVANETGVPAAIRAFKAYDRQYHPDLTAALVSLGENALPAVLDALAEEESLGVRKRLLEVVARQGERAFPYLLPLLDDARWFVVRNAAFLLRRLGHPDAARLLKGRIAGANPKVLAEILKALVALQDPQWFAVLIDKLDSGSEEQRRVALDVACRIRHPEVVWALVQRLSPRVGGRLREPLSLELIHALGRLRDPAALPVLRQILALRQWRHNFSLAPARREAAAAVARLEGPEARILALELLRSGDEAVAAGVKRAMQGQVEPEEDEP